MRRASIALACLLGLAACKRAPRGHGSQAGGGGAGQELEGPRRLRLLLRLDFRTPGMSFVTGLMPTAMHTEIERCKLDFARDFGLVDLEVANPRLFRVELSGAMSKEQVACALSTILGDAARVTVSDRAGGGLRIVTAGMPSDHELRAALERRLAEAPPGTQVAGVFLSGPPSHVIESTVWLGLLAGGELHIRFPTEAEVAPAKAQLVAWMGKPETVSVSGRELVIKDMAFQLVEDAARAVVASYDLQQDRMRPTLEPGDISFVGMAPYLGLLGRGDVAIFRCWDTPMALCSGRVVGVAGDKVVLRGGVLAGAEAAGRYKYTAAGTVHEMQLWRERSGTRTWQVVTGAGTNFAPVDAEVPADSLYVLEDNRDATSDSRTNGVVKRSQLVGLLAMTWWSMEDGKIRWDRVWKLVE